MIYHQPGCNFYVSITSSHFKNHFDPVRQMEMTWISPSELNYVYFWHGFVSNLYFIIKLQFQISKLQRENAFLRKLIDPEVLADYEAHENQKVFALKTPINRSTVNNFKPNQHMMHTVRWKLIGPFMWHS